MSKDRPVLDGLWRKRYVLAAVAVLGALAGGGIAVARQQIQPWYESGFQLTFPNPLELPSQGLVVLTSVATIVQNPDFVADIERASGTSLAIVVAQEGVKNRDLRILVQGHDVAAVQEATRQTADRILAVWASHELAGLSRQPPVVENIYRRGLQTGRTQGRVDLEVTERIPAPIIRATEKWYDQSLQVTEGPSPVHRLPARPIWREIVAGLLMGLGFAIAALAAAWQLADLGQQLKRASA